MRGPVRSTVPVAPRIITRQVASPSKHTRARLDILLEVRALPSLVGVDVSAGSPRMHPQPSVQLTGNHDLDPDFAIWETFFFVWMNIFFLTERA